MSVFQIICLVALTIEAVIFGVYIFLENQDSDEAEFFFYLFIGIAMSIGIMALLGGAIGVITVEVMA